MSRQSQHFVQRSFKFFLYICFISNISGSEPIPLDSFLNKIEVANDFQERKRGLMYRKALPQDQGMLFKWDSKKDSMHVDEKYLCTFKRCICRY